MAATRNDHQLGGGKRFVLSTSGHIAAIVNPPANKKATYRTAGERTPADPEAWLADSEVNQGTWWSDWDAWLGLGRLARGTCRRDAAPDKLGSRRHLAGDRQNETAPGFVYGR